MSNMFFSFLTFKTHWDWEKKHGRQYISRAMAYSTKGHLRLRKKYSYCFLWAFPEGITIYISVSSLTFQYVNFYI